VVGVSTLIGEAVLDELKARKFPHAGLHLLDEERHLGRPVSAGDSAAGDAAAGGSAGDDATGDAAAVLPVSAFDFSVIDLAFFCGRSVIAQQYAPGVAGHAWVVDSSSAFRARADVPLVVADVNPGVLPLAATHGLIALPGSASAALATALGPLLALGRPVRAEVATYQAVSGSGRSAMEELAGETVALLSGRKPRGKAFGRQIAFNVIPQVDAVEADGVSREERRIWEETRRVLALPDLAINVTAVRVPVFFGHGLAIHVAFDRPVSPADATAAWRAAGIMLFDSGEDGELPTPATLATAPDKVYIGRARSDPTRTGALNFWVVADNVRKCAAHNAVSVAQILVNSPR
jgi:aspartate-semialdehyde dehydrogenase